MTPLRHFLNLLKDHSIEESLAEIQPEAGEDKLSCFVKLVFSNQQEILKEDFLTLKKVYLALLNPDEKQKMLAVCLRSGLLDCIRFGAAEIPEGELETKILALNHNLKPRSAPYILEALTLLGVHSDETLKSLIHLFSSIDLHEDDLKLILNFLSHNPKDKRAELISKLEFFHFYEEMPFRGIAGFFFLLDGRKLEEAFFLLTDFLESMPPLFNMQPSYKVSFKDIIYAQARFLKWAQTQPFDKVMHLVRLHKSYGPGRSNPILCANLSLFPESEWEETLQRLHTRPHELHLGRFFPLHERTPDHVMLLQSIIKRQAYISDFLSCIPQEIFLSTLPSLQETASPSRTLVDFTRRLYDDRPDLKAVIMSFISQEAAGVLETYDTEFSPPQLPKHDLFPLDGKSPKERLDFLYKTSCLYSELPQIQNLLHLLHLTPKLSKEDLLLFKDLVFEVLTHISIKYHSDILNLFRMLPPEAKTLSVLQKVANLVMAYHDALGFQPKKLKLFLSLISLENRPRVIEVFEEKRIASQLDFTTHLFNVLKTLAPELYEDLVHNICKEYPLKQLLGDLKHAPFDVLYLPVSGLTQDKKLAKFIDEISSMRDVLLLEDLVPLSQITPLLQDGMLKTRLFNICLLKISDFTNAKASQDLYAHFSILIEEFQYDDMMKAFALLAQVPFVENQLRQLVNILCSDLSKKQRQIILTFLENVPKEHFSTYLNNLGKFQKMCDDQLLFGSAITFSKELSFIQERPLDEIIRLFHLIFLNQDTMLSFEMFRIIKDISTDELITTWSMLESLGLTRFPRPFLEKILLIPMDPRMASLEQLRPYLQALPALKRTVFAEIVLSFDESQKTEAILGMLAEVVQKVPNLLIFSQFLKRVPKELIPEVISNIFSFKDAPQFTSSDEPRAYIDLLYQTSPALKGAILAFVENTCRMILEDPSLSPDQIKNKLNFILLETNLHQELKFFDEISQLIDAMGHLSMSELIFFMGFLPQIGQELMHADLRNSFYHAFSSLIKTERHETSALKIKTIMNALGNIEQAKNTFELFAFLPKSLQPIFLDTILEGLEAGWLQLDQPILIQFFQRKPEHQELFRQHIEIALGKITDPRRAYTIASLISPHLELLGIPLDTAAAYLLASVLNLSHQARLLELKNPYRIYHLLDAYKYKNTPISKPKRKLMDGYYSLELSPLVEKQNQSRISHDMLPPAVNPQTLKHLFQNLKQRIDALDGPEKLATLGMISQQLAVGFDDIHHEMTQDAYLEGLLQSDPDPQKEVPEDRFHLFFILDTILKQSTEIDPAEKLSPQEKMLIQIFSSIRHCSGGKKEGLFLTFNSFKNTLSFGDSVATQSLKEFVLTTVLNLISSYVSEEGPLLIKLTQASPVRQLSHQAIYLKNLIGSSLGIQKDLFFDFYTGVLYDDLVKTSKQDALEAFYEDAQPDKIIHAMQGAINKLLSQMTDVDPLKSKPAKHIFAGISDLIGTSDFLFDDDTMITSLQKEGVIKLLVALGLFKAYD